MKKGFTILIVLFSTYCFSQNEASNWYFGENSGINFNSFNGAVTPLTDGQINTREGCASISDSNGNLLFYTDGTTVYNRFHDIMSNGENLLGDESSTQSAIVVPKPNDPNIYYIFTVGSNQSNTGLNYSIVDISANSTLGAVTTKNVNLISNCAEKISAVVKDCDTKSIWVISLSSSNGFFGSTPNLNTFYAYEVNGTGVNSNPIKSTLPININDLRGYLKLSPSGSKLACANVQSGLYLFDFDSLTGKVSNPLQLEINNVNDKPYGVEFSPNSDLLYITASNDYFNRNNASANDDPANHNSILLQYNLKAPNISDSQIILDSRNLYRSALQLGPNGKIYRSLSITYDTGLNSLAAINSPNVLGLSANYQHDAINLGANNSTQGLPPFIASFFNQQIDIIKNGNATAFLSLCENEEYTLTADIIPGAKYIWTRDDVLLSESSNKLLIDQNLSGTYKVIIEPLGNVITNSCGFPQGEAIVEYYPYPDAFDTSLYQCDLDILSDGITTFNLNEGIEKITGDTVNNDITVTFHYDQQNATNGTNPIPNPTTFQNNTTSQLYARVTHNISECSSTALVNLEISSTKVANFKADPVCDEINSEDGINTFSLDVYTPQILSTLNIPTTNLNIYYFKDINDALIEENKITDYTNTIPYIGKVYFRIENASTYDCFGINELDLSIAKLPNIEADKTTYYCLNKYPEKTKINAGVLNGSQNNYSYNWSTGESTYEIEINELGTYSVTITNNITGCSKNRTITVEASNIASYDNINVIDASKNNTITILVSGEGTYEYKLLNDTNNMPRPYQESNIFENVAPGIYTVFVHDIKNNCGEVPHKVSVIGFPKVFTPNGDGYNDTWQVKGISSMFQPNSKILIFNRLGKLIKELNPLGEGWNGLFNGNILPSDDYWFSVTLQDGRVFKNHFTLKH